MKILRLTSPELDIAEQLARLFKSGSASPQHLRQFLEAPTNYLIAVLEAGRPVGFLLAYALPRIDRDSARLFVYEIEVLPEFRRQGVGAAMIHFVQDILRKERMLSAFVLTNRSNPGAIAFYESTGAVAPTGDDLLLVYPGIE